MQFLPSPYNQFGPDIDGNDEPYRLPGVSVTAPAGPDIFAITPHTILTEHPELLPTYGPVPSPAKTSQWVWIALGAVALFLVFGGKGRGSRSW